MNRELSDNDYEMLLQLDENVPKKGATKAQIANLPSHIVEVILLCFIVPIID
jgi:hypothetical protein